MMDKARAAQLYKLADNLSKIDESTLSEQQIVERQSMIDRLKEELSKLQEKREEVRDEEGNLISWKDEGEWKKDKGEQKKDPVGKIHHMSDVARKETEKLSKKDEIEEAINKEAYERLYRVFDFSNFKG